MRGTGVCLALLLIAAPSTAATWRGRIRAGTAHRHGRVVVKADPAGVNYVGTFRCRGSGCPVRKGTWIATLGEQCQVSTLVVAPGGPSSYAFGSGVFWRPGIRRCTFGADVEGCDIDGEWSCDDGRSGTILLGRIR